MAFVPPKPVRIVRGNLRKTIQKFLRVGTSVYNYNGNHADFPLNLLPNPMRNNLKNILGNLRDALDVKSNDLEVKK